MTIGEGPWVIATRDFGYDDKMGKAKRGQVFQTGGHRNDGQLLDFNFIVVIDPQPKASATDKYPTCGGCGRRFESEHARDDCGRSHELTPAEEAEERRLKAHDRVLEASDSS